MVACFSSSAPLAILMNKPYKNFMQADSNNKIQVCPDRKRSRSHANHANGIVKAYDGKSTAQNFPK
jgi:hypothetical protein